jgi:putative ABC transport system substrate-binding protein
MRRRNFIALLGGTAAWTDTWFLAARAQQRVRVRRLGVLMGFVEGDPVARAFEAALRDGLAKQGWTEPTTLQIDLRFGATDPRRMRTYASELVNIAPEVIFVHSSLAARAVVVAVGDPVSNGLVRNIARPEGNATGFTNFLSTMGGKWMELLRLAAPRVDRVAVIFDPAITATFFSASIEAATSKEAVKLVKVSIRNTDETERAIDEFAAEPNGGLIVLPVNSQREFVLRLSAKHRLPAIYPYRYYAAEGGLMAYGVDNIDLCRRAATYVNRILGGARVIDLPVQFPTKFEFVINLKTAKALGLEIPQTVLALADEVIE